MCIQIHVQQVISNYIHKIWTQFKVKIVLYIPMNEDNKLFLKNIYSKQILRDTRNSADRCHVHAVEAHRQSSVHLFKHCTRCRVRA